MAAKSPREHGHYQLMSKQVTVCEVPPADAAMVFNAFMDPLLMVKQFAVYDVLPADRALGKGAGPPL
ncbi:hypothetical protein PRZ48_009858 [Zasmidium cellare]|uniref:Uncharacterized protein n=1 Tax=Zasmidium cellare TaxID=395010 RepID=A0ABR0EDH9_ZASCE|nr:hypothetical protein PRZ48_009858 [Zasmidium cellare]